MLKIADFTLSNYKKTLGREDGYCATLKYQNKAVATYEDFGTGALPNIDVLPNQEGGEALKKALTELKRVLPGTYIPTDTLEDCAMTMCGILDDLWEVPKFCKRAPQDALYAVFLLLGPMWTVSWIDQNIQGPVEIPVMSWCFLQNVDSALARVGAAKFLENALIGGEFSTCSGIWVIDLKDKDSFTLTLKQYIEIFRFAETTVKGLQAPQNR